MLSAKQLKNAWKNRVKYGGFAGSFKDFLRDESMRSDESKSTRDEGETYPDAAYLLLQRK
jgi:hypothetical protein